MFTSLRHLLQLKQYLLLIAVVWGMAGMSVPAAIAAPTVTATSPADSATGVPVTTSVTATFSEAMDPATTICRS